MRTGERRTAGMWRRGTVLAAALGMGLATPLRAQAPREPTDAPAGAARPQAALPFAVGEELKYRVRVAGLGSVGHGEMTVSGAELRDRPAYLLRFSVRTRIGLLVSRDSSRSWLDPARMASLRFFRQERRTFGGSDREAVELFPDQRRWQDGDGDAGTSPTAEPLDELSFLYFLRTLPLRVGDHYELNRHFDAARNPVVVDVVGREAVDSPAGHFSTLVVEMRVKDPEHFHGEGLIRLYLSDDAHRVPVRIESSAPIFGTATLLLESYRAPPPAVRLAR